MLGTVALSYLDRMEAPKIRNSCAFDLRSNPPSEIKAALIIDGNHFHIMRNFYSTINRIQKPISISKFIEFIKTKVSALYGIPPNGKVDLSEKHVFVGRPNPDINDKDDWVCMANHIEVHKHRLMRSKNGFKKGGVDMDLAFTTDDLVQKKHLNVIVLVTGNSDFNILVDKLNHNGCDVVLIAWSNSISEDPNVCKSDYSKELASKVNYTIRLDEEIADFLENQKNSLIRILFEDETVSYKDYVDAKNNPSNFKDHERQSRKATPSTISETPETHSVMTPKPLDNDVIITSPPAKKTSSITITQPAPIHGIHNQESQMSEIQAAADIKVEKPSRKTPVALTQSESNDIKKDEGKSDIPSSEKLFAEGNQLYKERKYREAIEKFRSAADMHNSGAMYMLGECYQHGYGVDVSIPDAIDWFRKGADLGDSWSRGSLKKLIRGEGS